MTTRDVTKSLHNAVLISVVVPGESLATQHHDKLYIKKYCKKINTVKIKIIYRQYTE